MSAVHQAVFSDSPAFLQLLLERNAKIDLVNSDGLTPLQAAVVNGNSAELIAPLVKAGANPNEPVRSSGTARGKYRSGNEFDIKGAPPLIIAIRKEELEMAEALLQNGADVNARFGEPFDATAAMYALWANKSIFELVLRYKPDLKIGTKIEGKTILHNAAGSSTHQWAIEPLLKSGAPINGADSRGMTPLHYAVAAANEAVAELLLKNGANPNAVNAGGQPPLSLLPSREPGNLRRGRTSIGELLLKYGANQLLTRPQTISVTRSSRNFEEVVFRKGTNELNRHSLYELLATFYTGGRQTLNFPDLRQITVERLQPDQSVQTIPVDLFALTRGNNNICTNDVWLQWGDRIEIPETDHPISDTWSGLPTALVINVAACLQRSVEIVAKGRTNRYQLRASRPNYGYFVMDSFRLYDVVQRSGLVDNSSHLPIRVTRKTADDSKPLVMEFSKQPEADLDLWLRDGDVIQVVSQ
jgi:ankyrin repeat protein